MPKLNIDFDTYKKNLVRYVISNYCQKYNSNFAFYQKKRKFVKANSVKYTAHCG